MSTINGVFLSFFLLQGYFTPRRGSPKLVKFCMGSLFTKILGFHYKKNQGPPTPPALCEDPPLSQRKFQIHYCYQVISYHSLCKKGVLRIMSKLAVCISYTQFVDINSSFCMGFHLIFKQLKQADYLKI